MRGYVDAPVPKLGGQGDRRGATITHVCDGQVDSLRDDAPDGKRAAQLAAWRALWRLLLSPDDAEPAESVVPDDDR